MISFTHPCFLQIFHKAFLLVSTNFIATENESVEGYENFSHGHVSHTKLILSLKLLSSVLNLPTVGGLCQVYAADANSLYQTQPPRVFGCEFLVGEWGWDLEQ